MKKMQMKKMDMNEARELLRASLIKSGCNWEFKRGKCWITSSKGKFGFRFFNIGYDIYGFKVGRTKILFGKDFYKNLCAKISELE